MQQLIIGGPEFSSFVRSVVLMCRYKDIPYEVVQQWNGKSLQIGAEDLAEFHPFSKVPVLFHGDLVLPESLAIGRYIDGLDKRDKPLFPHNSQEAAKVDAWSNMISRYVDQAIIRNYIIEIKFPKGPDGTIRMEKVNQSKGAVDLALTQLEKQLSDSAFLMGTEFTICDALLIPMLDYLTRMPDALNRLPVFAGLSAYLGRVRQMAVFAGVLV